MTRSARAEQAGPYAHAEWYDLLHAGATASQCAMLRRIARRVAGADALAGTWLEPACGTGRLLIRLARLGAGKVVGVDLERDMIALAKRKAHAAGLGRQAVFVRGDIAEMSVPCDAQSVDVAFCLDNSIRHVMSDGAMVRHLQSVGDLLTRDGVYLVGVGLSSREGDFPSDDVIEARKGTTSLRQVIEFMPAGPGKRRETAYSVLAASVGGVEQVITSSYTLRTYTPEQWGSVVRKAGLVERCVVDERGDELDPSRTGYAIRVLARAATARSARRVSASATRRAPRRRR